MNKDVALVLSSGGARGIAHIGVINTLIKNGYNIKSVAGSSMGALVGGIYAAGKLDVLQEWLKQLTKREVLKLVDITISSNGLVKGERLINEMEEMIPDRSIESLEIPFTAIATDILKEEEIVFTDGKLYDAIRASISIPSVLTPHKIKGRQLVDGGVVNPLPTNRVKRFKDDILVASDVNARVDREMPVVTSSEENDAEHESSNIAMEYINRIQEKLGNIIPYNRKDKIGLFNLMNRSTSLMLHVITQNSIERNPPDILINIDRGCFGTFDFYKAKDIIEAGERACEEALKNLH